MSLGVIPPAPFPPVEPIDLGQFFRGDTCTFTLELSDAQGQVVDLTGTDVWFTAKTDLALDDLEGLGFQLSTLSAGVEILDPPTDGNVLITIPPSATSGLEDDTLFFWDLQCKKGATVQTYRAGTVLVVRDVTRTVS